MATVIAHDSGALHDITSSSLQTQSSCSESSNVRSKSCSPESMGGPSEAVHIKSSDVILSQESPESVSTGESTGKLHGSSGKSGGVGESKSDTTIPTSKVKIFDNKVFVEAPLPKTNPWTKSKPSLPQTLDNRTGIKFIGHLSLSLYYVLLN